MTLPFFKPWIGKEYSASPNKLLILGESHYSSEAVSSSFTQELTQDYVDGVMSHRFWTNIMQAIEGKPHEQIDRKLFWNDVAFYNYVQQPVAESAGVAPTAEMFTASENAFFSVLNELKPNKILVISCRLWDNLPQTGINGPALIHDNHDYDTWIYPYDGGKALATCIPHPSYYFSWKMWHSFIRTFCNSIET